MPSRSYDRQTRIRLRRKFNTISSAIRSSLTYPLDPEDVEGPLHTIGVVSLCQGGEEDWQDEFRRPDKMLGRIMDEESSEVDRKNNVPWMLYGGFAGLVSESLRRVTATARSAQ